MRILWVIHLYPPKHNCGAEYVAHTINKFMLSRGHQVRVFHMQSENNYTFEGVDVFGGKFTDGIDPYSWGDVICTHLDFTQHAINMGHFVRRPVFNFVHNSSPYSSILRAQDKQFIVYNSEWISKALNYNNDSIVLYPPCPIENYRIPNKSISSEYITLINVNEDKGGYIFYRLAKALPNRKFLAINGSYDNGGLMPDILKLLSSCKNVKVENHTPDVKSIYARTKILLMPSRMETWGRTATEAMINGIPIICTATEGLKENCGDAGIYIPDRGPKILTDDGRISKHDGYEYDISPIVDEINKLDNPNNYNIASMHCVYRSEFLNDECIRQLNNLENFFHYGSANYKYNGNTYR